MTKLDNLEWLEASSVTNRARFHTACAKALSGSICRQNRPFGIAFSPWAARGHHRRCPTAT
jgi:hypothetical protein